MCPPFVIRVGLIILAIIGLGVCTSLLLSLAERLLGSETPFSIVINSQDNSWKVYKGNLNGVPIVIPGNQIYFPIEYKDTSIWDPSTQNKRQTRTFDDAIRAFSIQWPDINPRRSEVKGAPSDGTYASQIHPWMRIAVTDDSRAPRPPETPDNGLARVLKGKLERFSERAKTIIDPNDPERSRRIKVTDVRYASQGTDHITGLQWAEPVGPGTERFYSWNLALYWQGEKNGIVSDFIRCFNGEIPVPDTVQRCYHRFELLELNATRRLSR